VETESRPSISNYALLSEIIVDKIKKQRKENIL
jgi:hypothetical protein